jgi:hypothetical protein
MFCGLPAAALVGSLPAYFSAGLAFGLEYLAGAVSALSILLVKLFQLTLRQILGTRHPILRAIQGDDELASFTCTAIVSRF